MFPAAKRANLAAARAPSRSLSDRVALITASFCAVTALGGALELLIWRGGNEYLPIRLLEPTPFETFLLPGLLLGGVVGGTSLVAAIAVRRGVEWRADAVQLAGGVLIGWIGCESVILQEWSWLQAAYGCLGAVLLVAGLVGSNARSSLRQKWVITVTAAESIGYLAPALAGVLTAHWSLAHEPTPWVVIAGGFLEGCCLGFGQSRVLPWKVNRAYFACATGVAACAIWAAVFAMMTGASADQIPAWIKAASGIVLGTGSLVALGGVQWLFLREFTPRAKWWIVWTGVAWSFALPMSFLPGPLVDEATPLSTHVVLWASAGVLMAYVMAWVTWLGLRTMTTER